jgi:predicted nucleotidyltransferase
MKTIDTSKITTYLQNIGILDAAYLYGSFASQKETPSSDIDIAILLCDEQLDFHNKNNVILELNDMTGREVDCVELDKVSPILQMQIIKKGQLLFCKNEIQLNELKVKIIRQYIDLKKIRKPIEDRLKNVSIYG